MALQEATAYKWVLRKLIIAIVNFDLDAFLLGCRQVDNELIYRISYVYDDPSIGQLYLLDLGDLHLLNQSHDSLIEPQFNQALTDFSSCG